MVRLVLAISVIFLVVLSIMPAFGDSGVISVVSGKTFQVNYNANGVKIQDIETNPTYDELTVTVQVSSPNAYLELTIPRDLLDSKQGNNDIPFIAVVDGTLGNVEEKNPTSTTRTVSIQLTPDNKQIEIIGTFVAISGPSGNQVTSPPSNVQSQPMPSQQTTNQSAATTSSPTTVINPTPKVPPATKPTTQTGISSGNAIIQTNMTQNITFKIPYLPNVTISLSMIDLAVIGAISLVVIIVIASVARRRPSKIIKSR